jgi:hypothetical protein
MAAGSQGKGFNILCRWGRGLALPSLAASPSTLFLHFTPHSLLLAFYLPFLILNSTTSFCSSFTFSSLLFLPPASSD